ncbi:thioredoxin domain-containing protein [Roseomonas sp. BU-1]|uniref:Thioredoxin domain-containing protein n=2 Tax=Falsiroseomonas selenitidurans TaxID=2716335 RepID=A0ABX1EC78_9PROT|nr:thioredoxin domain-containing protein [Falsiroseomonas selenitidurans]
MIDRRSLLTLAATGAAGLLLPRLGWAQAAAPAPLAEDDPRLAERSAGPADAPVTVLEYFSLTCGHCAAFHRETWPRVKTELVQAGRMRMVFRDFPLDGLALAAAAVARSLPAPQYEPFISALLGSQDRWAFNRNADPREELYKMAALAGMSRARYDEVLADQALQRAILAARVKGQQEHNVTSTPTFVFGRRAVPGNMAFGRFAALVAETR